MRQKLREAKHRYVAAGKRHARLAKRVVTKPLFSIPFAIALVITTVTVVAFSQRSRVTPVLKTTDANVVLLSYDKKQHTIPTNAKPFRARV